MAKVRYRADVSVVEPPNFKSDREMHEWKKSVPARREESITFTVTHANPVGQRMTLPLANVSTTDAQPKCFCRLFDLSIH